MTESAVEKEIHGLIKIRPKNYESRQDYLAAVVRAVEKLKDDDYDNMTEDAYNWHRAACEAMNDKEIIPDMDGSIGEPEPEAEEVEMTNTGEVTEPDVEAEEVDPSTLVEPTNVKVNKAIKTGLRGKGTGKRGPRKGSQVQPSENAKILKTDYTTLTGEKDKFGITIGTKTHYAVQMYEKGASSKQIEDAIGGRYFNILKKLLEDGHRVENDSGVWKVTHKEELSK